MHRQPRAVGSPVVRSPLVVLGAIVVAALLLVPSFALARTPGQGALGRPISADAVELARTAPEAVLAGTTDESCTGWLSTYAPPPSIRVLRTVGPAKGQVQVVPFRAYVTQVMASEWPAYYPMEANRVGALAIKNYGWYFTIVYRGGENAAGECYDVRDYSVDQGYQPEKRTPASTHKKAVRTTWSISIRKWNGTKGTSEFFLTGYRTGSSTICAGDADGRLLYQRSILRCANKGYTHEQIMRMYLTNKVELVEPAAHDIVGLEPGDASALFRNEDDSRTPMLFETAPPSPMSLAGGPMARIAPAGFAGVRSVDMDRDGRDDLLTLHTPGPSGYVLQVAKSDGSSYGAPQTWAQSTDGSTVEATLLSGDFDANGHADGAILSTGTEAGSAVLKVFLSTGAAFSAPIDWWTGALDLATQRVWAGDANGDGRTDLIVARDLGGGGMEYVVIASRRLGGGLGSPATWYVGADLRWATTRTVVGDTDRDGRDDLSLITPAASGSSRVDVTALKAAKTSPVFQPVLRWTSAAADGMSLDAVKAGSADVDYNGFSDLVLYIDRGADGTRVVKLGGGYVTMSLGAVLDVPGLDWSRVAAY